MPPKKNKAIFPGLMKGRAKSSSSPAGAVSTSSPASQAATSPVRAAEAQPTSSAGSKLSAVAVEGNINVAGPQDPEESTSSLSNGLSSEDDLDLEVVAKRPMKPAKTTARKTSTGRPRGRPPKNAAKPTKRIGKKQTEKKKKKVSVSRAWHKEFVKDIDTSAASTTKRTASKIEGIRQHILQDIVENSQTGPEPFESIDEILARPAPPDEPEYTSFATARADRPMWAPLLGGTTSEEKSKIEQELAAAEILTIPDRYHPEYLKTRNEDPGNFNKLLFYEGVAPKRKLAIAGVAKEPLVIDPPGSGTPFDALKFPDRLVAQLNRDDAETLYGWNSKAMKRIPKELMAQLKPEILAKMPDEVLSRLPPEILDHLPSDHSFFGNLPFNSKLKRPEHRAGYLRRQSASQAEEVPRQASKEQQPQPRSDTWAVRGQDGKFLIAPKRGPGGKFLPKSALADAAPPQQQRKGKERATEPEETSPTLQSQHNGKGRSIEPEETSPTPQPQRKGRKRAFELDDAPFPKGSAAPISSDKCVMCTTMGVKCNGERPECLWCRKNGYQCSFLTDTALDTGPASLDPNPGLDLDSLPVQEGTQAYFPSFLQEESFSSRPSIRITIPDHLKSLLVDDWENVTKSLLLVPLPSQAPANFIIDTYYNEEKMNRRLGSAEADVLEEFCAGMKVYFEKSVGKILLYRFERSQLADVSTSQSIPPHRETLTLSTRFASSGNPVATPNGKAEDQETAMAQST